MEVTGSSISRSFPFHFAVSLIIFERRENAKSVFKKMGDRLDEPDSSNVNLPSPEDDEIDSESEVIDRMVEHTSYQWLWFRQ